MSRCLLSGWKFISRGWNSKVSNWKLRVVNCHLDCSDWRKAGENGKRTASNIRGVNIYERFVTLITLVYIWSRILRKTRRRPLLHSKLLFCFYFSIVGPNLVKSHFHLDVSSANVSVLRSLLCEKVTFRSVEPRHSTFLDVETDSSEMSWWPH